MQPSYFDELCRAMRQLAADKRVIFVGQAVAVQGTTMTATFAGVPTHQKLEFPVAEDMQMGFCTGLALGGLIPVCIFPRWNFALCAANQLVNHLDRLPIYSRGGYRPRVIIRVAAPSIAPLNPGPQHDDDFTVAFRHMLRTIQIVELKEAAEIVPAYTEAVHCDTSTILVERTELYQDHRGKP